MPRSFWLDTLPERPPHPPLEETLEADLCIVGGGYTGLWAALYAKALDPGREVVLLEATRCGAGASGRNGGFVQSSLTHGTRNGLTRFPREMGRLERLGRENFDGLSRDLDALNIDAELAAAGDLVVALEPHEIADLADEAELLRRFGYQVELLDGEQVRAEINSKKFISAHVDADRLRAGPPGQARRRSARRGRPRRRAHPRAQPRCASCATRVSVITDGGVVNARGVLLATSAYPPLAARDPPLHGADLRLRAGHRAGRSERWSAGATARASSDMGNQFHYYRLTADGRILWGGYDAVYRYGGPVGPGVDDHDPAFARLSQHFFTVFPQLEGVRFTHRWGGAIDTCSRFSVFFGRALGGRVTYALGYTGLGVAASRFGGRVALDLLDGRAGEATELALVRRRPLPFPPEPLRSAVIQLTRNRLAAADRNEGRRGLWLTALDRLGLGFDS